MAAALVGLVVALVLILAVGTYAAALRAQVPDPRRYEVGVAVGLSVWLGVSALLAHLGALAVYDAVPPRVLLLAGSGALVGVGLSRAPGFERLLGGVPLHWVPTLQGFRFVVEMILWRSALDGVVPIQMTFGGRNFDLLVGVTGPLVGWLVSRGRIGPRALLGWNLVGVGLLANVVGIAVTSFPGPLHLDWPGAPLTSPMHFPFVWLPAFLVPLALFLHLVSIRQAVAKLRTG